MQAVLELKLNSELANALSISTLNQVEDLDFNELNPIIKMQLALRILLDPAIEVSIEVTP